MIGPYSSQSFAPISRAARPGKPAVAAPRSCRSRADGVEENLFHALEHLLEAAIRGAVRAGARAQPRAQCRVNEQPPQAPLEIFDILSIHDERGLPVARHLPDAPGAGSHARQAAEHCLDQRLRHTLVRVRR